jgi:hypothetical protein
MARRKTTTAKVTSAARRNISRAQVSRVRRKEPRSLGRVRKTRTTGVF